MAETARQPTADDRIRAKLQAGVEKAARSKALAEAAHNERLVNQVSTEGMLGAAVFELFDQVDLINRRKKQRRKASDFVAQILSKTRITRYKSSSLYFANRKGGWIQDHMLDGTIDGSAIKLPNAQTTVQPDGNFENSLQVELGTSSISYTRDFRTVSEGKAECNIYEVTTETRSGIEERDLVYQVLAVYTSIGERASVRSYTNGSKDEPLVAIGKDSTEHALGLVTQALEVVQSVGAPPGIVYS